MTALISTSDIPRVAVVPTHNRPQELLRLLGALSSQVDYVYVIDNASSPPTVSYDPNVTVLRDEEQPPNLSRLWNLGLNMAAQRAAVLGWVAWDVAVFNDDAVPPAGWWDAVSEAMRQRGAAAACSDPHDNPADWGHYVTTTPDGDIMRRMCGWAFMLRGEVGLRADERFRWWFGDTDLDWRARKAGGMVIVPGFPVGNTLANTTTVGALAEQAGRDRQTFIDKWGWAPW